MLWGFFDRLARRTTEAIVRGVRDAELILQGDGDQSPPDAEQLKRIAAGVVGEQAKTLAELPAGKGKQR